MAKVVFLLFAGAFGAKLEVDVEDFGAKADNKTVSSDGINKAIKNMSARGGGIVHCRAKGSYLVGRIDLRSNVELRISPSTTLQASDREENWKAYTIHEPERCGGTSVTNNTRGGVFRAVKAKDFSITGGGTIDGGGLKWNNDKHRGHPLPAR